MQINWNENSTKMGLVWLVFGIAGLVLLFLNRKEDIVVLLTLAASVSGGMGFTQPDKK